jgi:short-subunit dehydrogenase
VNVTCLAPGPTATALYDANQIPIERARRLGVMLEAETVADAGLRAMFAGRAEHIPGLLTRAMTAAAVVTPQWAIDQLRRRAPWLPKVEP